MTERPVDAQGARQTALGQVLQDAGFTRCGTDWRRDLHDIRWDVFLSVDRRDDGDLHDVAFSAQYLALPATAHDVPYLVNQSLTDLPSASRAEYRAAPTRSEDSLVVDVRDVLVPLMTRLTTADAVMDAWISGELGWRTWPRSARIAHGLRLAKRYNFPAHQRRAEALAASGNWTATDRWYFHNAGLSLPGEIRHPAQVAWFDRLFRRKDPRFADPVCRASETGS